MTRKRASKADHIRRLALRGLTNKAIADECVTTIKYVSQTLHDVTEHQCPNHGADWDPVDVDRMVAMYLSGIRLKDIAAILGRTRMAIATALHSRGVSESWE